MTAMNNLRGMLIKQLVDISTPYQSRWVASTLDDSSVLIKYECGALTVSIAGTSTGYTAELNSPSNVALTTEVMLLVTGLRVV